MEFMYIQLVIFLTIILSAVIGGKKGAAISFLVWSLETYIVFNVDRFSYLQLITLGLGFQIAIMIAIIRDLLVKQFKKSQNN
jgi:formate hydrogenlyase subunit 3/multisubunit Na+/H+ antiporter MnhD subunit